MSSTVMMRTLGGFVAANAGLSTAHKSARIKEGDDMDLSIPNGRRSREAERLIIFC
jgi:hypothetical protein